jgi:Rieske Fe-S protein
MEKLNRTQVLEVMREVARLEASARKQTNKAATLRTKLQEDLCPHEEIKTVERYCKGGYDYKSIVIISKYCAHCGVLLETYDDPTHLGQFG